MVWPMQQPTAPVYQRPRFNGMPANNRVQHHAMHRPFPPSKPKSKGILTPERMDGLTKTLGNVQRVLKAVETAAPIAQQYAPMVKNLPMMFKLMKELKKNDSEENTNEEENDKEDEEDNQLLSVKDLQPQQQQPQVGSSGESMPRLFI